VGAHGITVLEPVLVALIVDLELCRLHLSEDEGVAVTCLGDRELGTNLSRHVKYVEHEVSFPIEQLLGDHQLLLGEELLIFIDRLDHLVCAGDYIKKNPFNTLDDKFASPLWAYVKENLLSL
jgi:hypothetical protein